MKKEIMPLVEEVKRYSTKIYGSKIKQVIVYGSYARGEENEESDVDVLSRSPEISLHSIHKKP